MASRWRTRIITSSTAVSDKNVAILLTPAGAGAIAAIRIIGPATGAFLGRYFSKHVTPMRCVHGELRDQEGRVLDDIVVVLLSDGKTADLNVHGGPWVIESVQKLLRESGFADGAMLDAFDSDDVIER